MKKIVIVILLTIFLPSFVFAEDISVEELLGTEDEESAESVAVLEEERTEEIENELNISVPEYTDNPSHIITFVDPSEEKEGVEIDIDESGYKDISSPYSLPSLSIGEHHLKLRFVDSIGATKVLEYDVVIIPRPPVIKAPEFSENNLILSGTGFANSEVVIILSVGANNYTQIAEIDSDGDWNTTINMDSIIKGIYTIWGYTRKDGYASNPSEPAVLEYGEEGVVETSTTESSNIYFDFNDIQLDNIPNIIIQNPDLLIALISFLLFGALTTSLLFILIRGPRDRTEEKEISKKINGKPKKEKTLLELFGEEKQIRKEDEKKEKKKKDRKRRKKDKKKKDKKKKEEKSKKKVFTKHDFLKDFKGFDPDKDSGKENKEPSKKEKRDVVVTLTSKREE